MNERGRSLTAVAAAAPPGFGFDNTFARDLAPLCEPWQAASFPRPELVVLNESLAEELGLDPDALRNPATVGSLAGNPAPTGSTPVAQVYAGHQFGNYNPRLGDGRALLLGEVVDRTGRRRDLHLKGAGRTPFARGGDGKAALGPMLREFVIGEALHALGIPATRALAVLSTGEAIARDALLPGAVLHRVAASHIRVGTFEYTARLADAALLRRLADYVIARHYPEVQGTENPYLGLYTGVVDRQASLIAQWMLVGFVHGVMNTDNMTLSGESIDFGPCAFMDAYDPATVFSSIDHGGRYAYGNQPAVAQWNLARLGEALLPLVADEPQDALEPVTEVLRSFKDRYEAYFASGLRRRLGIDGLVGPVGEHADELGAELIGHLAAQRLDLTTIFRSLSSLLAPGAASSLPNDWLDRWRRLIGSTGRSASQSRAMLDAVNPIYVPRNHEVDAALNAAVAGDLGPFHLLVSAVSNPYHERPGLERFALPAPVEFASRFQTFCGT